MSSSRSAPRMPLRAASTGTRRLRAAWITAAALAFITAVTPPDWAYRSVPLLIRAAFLFDLSGPGR
jgi:hypothetical protein